MMNGMEPFAFWNNDKWDGLLFAFLNNSMNLVAIVFVYDKESFGCLMAFVHKFRFTIRPMFESVTYHLREEELPLKW